MLSCCASFQGRAFRLALLLFALFAKLQLVLCQDASQISIRYLYWNSSSFRKHNSTSATVVQANLSDQLVIVCPYLASNAEYYTVYYTSLWSAVRSCNVTADPNAVALVMCTNQYNAVPSIFTLIPSNPFYRELVFQPGNQYYLFSTSTMQADGIGNLVGGACSSIGAAVTINMACCADSLASVSTTVRTETNSTCCATGLSQGSARSLASSQRNAQFGVLASFLFLLLLLRRLFAIAER